MKTIKINPPKGYEVDKEKSTFEEIVFKPIQSAKEIFFKDERDGNVYKTVKIGDQVWMAENLRYISNLPLIVKNKEWIEINHKDKAVCIYNNDLNNLKKYGALYTWEAAKAACPKGWHLPTDNEWDELVKYVENKESISSVLENASRRENKEDSIDNFEFNILPGGVRNFYDGMFNYLEHEGYWWSATEDNSNNAYSHSMYYDFAGVNYNFYYKSNGFSVRCIKD